jgi:cell division protein FtsQ
MEIKTTKDSRETDAERMPLPEKSRYLRRASNHKVRKSQGGSGFIMRTFRFIGKVAVLILAFSFVISAVIFTFTSDRLSLRNVRVYGCSRADAKKLESVVRQSSPAKILRVDLKKLRRVLEEQTWVRRAELRRVLPSDLVVYIQERLPAVIVEVGQDLMIADEEGILLDSYDPRYGKLDVPVFKGVLGDSAENYRMYQQENSERVRLGMTLLTELESGSSAFTREISEVDLSEKSNLKILLVDETAEIYLGDRDFLKRFRTLMSNMSQYREIKNQYVEIGSVDLRFDGQIVYRPRHTETAEARP